MVMYFFLWSTPPLDKCMILFSHTMEMLDLNLNWLLLVSYS